MSIQSRHSSKAFRPLLGSVLRASAPFAVAASLVLVAACSQSQEQEQPTADDREPARTGESDLEQPATEHAEEVDKPRSAPVDPTPDATLGTVPDGHGLDLGAPIPDVTIASAEGEPAELRTVAGSQPVLIGFYRGGWCPFCNTQIRELSTRHDVFAERGVVPIMISVDQPGEAAKTEAAYEIPFPVLSDSDLEAHNAFRVLFEVPEEDVERMKAGGMDLEASSGRDHHKLALPSLFLFDENGVLLWQHVDSDYRVRPRIEQILEVLDEHGYEPGA
jgi:peroxiredoxin